MEKGGWEGGEYGLFAANDWLATTGTPVFQIYGLPGNIDDEVTGPDIRDGQWHFLAGTWNGTTIALYVDGIQADSLSGAAGTRTTNSGPLTIGAGWYGTMDYLQGAIDEVRVYGRALSAYELQESYFSNLSKYDVDEWLLSVTQARANTRPGCRHL